MGATHLSGPLFVGGVPVSGTPPVTGRVFFADSAGAATQDLRESLPTGYYRTSIASLLASGLVRANKGDVIYVLPGHTETISAAAGINMATAGVSVIGLGQGAAKPMITLGTATTSTFKINANNCLVRGLRFVSAIDSLVKFVDVNGHYATIEDCEFITSSGVEALSFVNLATTFDYLTVRRCRFEQPTDPGGNDSDANTGAIYLVDSEYVLIEDCWFQGNFAGAIIHNSTTACKYLYVRNCFGIQARTGSEPFGLVSGTSGAMLGGGFITATAADTTETDLIGTVGNAFFVLQPGAFGNDGGAGGQGGIVVTAAS